MSDWSGYEKEQPDVDHHASIQYQVTQRAMQENPSHIRYQIFFSSLGVHFDPHLAFCFCFDHMQQVWGKVSVCGE